MCSTISKLLARAGTQAGEFSFGGQTDTLPSVPGILVDGVRPIPVPLTGEVAQKLITSCEQSPFGHKLETLVDESVRKSWQLESSQLQLTNPLWHKGIEELAKTIAERLGYKDIPLTCKLYRLLSPPPDEFDSEEERDEDDKDKDKYYPAAFYRGMCQLLVDIGDPLLVLRCFSEFWSDFDPALDEDAFVQSMVSVASNVDWDVVGQTLLNSLDRLKDPVGVALQVAGGLQSGAVHAVFLKTAVEKAVALNDHELCNFKRMELLWKRAFTCGDTNILASIANRFSRVDPSLLFPVVEAFSKFFVDLDKTDEKYKTLAAIAMMRATWLDRTIQEMDQPFSWEMPEGCFPENAEVEAFLRGPEASTKTTGTGSKSSKDVQAARNYAAKWNHMAVVGASFKAEADESAVVTITKTREWFDAQQEKTKAVKAKRSVLTEKFAD